MTVKYIKFKPKIKEEEVLERIYIEIEFNNEGQDTKENYLIMYREFPDMYRIYPVCGCTDISKGEVNSALKYYMSRFMKFRNGKYEEMTMIPTLSGSYEEI